MNCPRCQTANPDGARYCSGCGFELASSASRPSGDSEQSFVPTAEIATDAQAQSSQPSGAHGLVGAGPQALPEGFEIGQRYRVSNKIRKTELQTIIAIFQIGHGIGVR